jgi:formylglycine-generating enzyme required for sulfatase activity
MHILSQAQFQSAFEHGAVRSVEIEPHGSQFAVKALTLTGEAMLVQARKAEPRLFGTLDSALKLLHKLGVRRIAVERLENWRPEQAADHRRSRPDRSVALNHAAQYERWVSAKVENSRNDTRLPLTEQTWQVVRAAKLAQRATLLAEQAT